ARAVARHAAAEDEGVRAAVKARGGRGLRPRTPPTGVCTRALARLPRCLQDEAPRALSHRGKFRISQQDRWFSGFPDRGGMRRARLTGMEVQVMFDIPAGMGLPVDIIEVSALYTSLSTVGLVWLALSAILLLVLLLAGRAIEPTDVLGAADAADAGFGPL